MSGIDPAKLADSFRAWFPGLVLYARQWLDAAEAEDVVQEVFLRLLAEPVEPANVKAWLYLATRRTAMDAARSARRRERRERAVAERAAATAWFQSGPADRIDAAAAEAALAELPPAQREVVLLRIWGGMTLAEVAGVVGNPLSTVYDQYRAALARLRKILESPCQTHSTPQAATSPRSPRDHLNHPDNSRRAT